MPFSERNLGDWRGPMSGARSVGVSDIWAKRFRGRSQTVAMPTVESSPLAEIDLNAAPYG